MAAWLMIGIEIELLFLDLDLASDAHLIQLGMRVDDFIQQQVSHTAIEQRHVSRWCAGLELSGKCTLRPCEAHAV